MQYPRHVAIIPDGNRTWAKNNNKDTIEGHMEGVTTSQKLIKHIFSNTTIQTLTLRGLSTENTCNRPPQELTYLMKIFLDHTIDAELNAYLLDSEINYRWIGNPEGLDPDLVQALHTKMQEHTYPNSERTICIAINYGGRDEIIRAIQKYITHHDPTTISLESIEQYMDTHDLPNPDLVIRTKTSYAKRLSGFMLWQAAYAELYFTDTLFPDFNTKQIDQALHRYNDIVHYRNFGK